MIFHIYFSGFLRQGLPACVTGLELLTQPLLPLPLCIFTPTCMVVLTSWFSLGLSVSALVALPDSHPYLYPGYGEESQLATPQ